LDYNLEFNSHNYKINTLSLDNVTITYRAYENIVYVKKPLDMDYQIMNIYVPELYYEDKPIGNYNSDNAPILLPITVGGYMPGAPEIPGKNRFGHLNAAFIALSKGYVVAAPGARGRTLQDDNGQYTGKAPACIVDLKAAIRYLRYNKELIPGDTEKIISNGTSAGGALSSLLGSTGNHMDYEPYLDALGAAKERDDIFAASCYCPITNLENADIAYEWMFNGMNDYNTRVRTVIGNQTKFTPVRGTMSEEQILFSDELKKCFPTYLNSLKLKTYNGTELKLNSNGEGTFKSYVKSFLITSAQRALENGTDLSEFKWITTNNGVVLDIDFEQFLQFATRMKPTLAYDSVELSTPENELFGTSTIKAQHFTDFSKKHSKVKGSIADLTIVKMMNPMNYIGNKESDAAVHWRIRHGAIDRDTSLAIPVILATKLENNGFNVDFALPWGQGHGGDYDLDEMFTWIDNISIQVGSSL
jgi:hypothetical protein